MEAVTMACTPIEEVLGHGASLARCGMPSKARSPARPNKLYAYLDARRVERRKWTSGSQSLLVSKVAETN